MSASFVFWPAERCRRDYAGGPLSWDFLTEPFDVEIDQAELRDLTRRGLGHFGRGNLHRSAGGTQYLRSLAAEGGIPVALLSGSGTWPQVLSGLVSDLERFGPACPAEVADSFAAHRSARLPLGYRTEEFRRLFVDLARELVGLRAALPESVDSEKALLWLDTARPGWRDGLTLRLDDAGAERLLAQVVGQRRGVATSLPLRRLLVRGPEVWAPAIEISSEALIAASHISPPITEERLRLAPSGDLAAASPNLMLRMERDEAAPAAAVRLTRLSGPRTARFPFALESAATFVGMADGRVLGEIRLPMAEALAVEEGACLWTADGVDPDGETNRLALAGDGSFRTPDPAVWALVPPGSSPHTTEHLNIVSDSPAGNSRLLKLEGRGRLSVTGWSARIETGAEHEQHDMLLAAGLTIPGLRDAGGNPVHRGLPSIFHCPSSGPTRTLPPGRAMHRMAGNRAWAHGAPSEDAAGTVQIALKDEDGGVGAMLRLRVMPEGLTLRIVEDGPEPNLNVSGAPPGWCFALMARPERHARSRSGDVSTAATR